MRGRLIFGFQIELFQLDTSATAAVDPAGPATKGYDDVFREPVKIPSGSGQGPGTTNRVEKAAVLIPAQIEPVQFERLSMYISGDSPDSDFTLVMHFRWLENNGFVDANGNATIRVNDRLARVLSACGTKTLMTVRDPLYIDQVMPSGFGIGHDRNLLIAHFIPRTTGAGPNA